MQQEKVMQRTTTETNTGGLTMNEATNREVDTITTKELPAWRAELLSHIENKNFSDTFHAACQNLMAAMLRASDEDETTHAPLKAALEEYMRIGKNELLLHDSCVEGLPC